MSPSPLTSVTTDVHKKAKLTKTQTLRLALHGSDDIPYKSDEEKLELSRTGMNDLQDRHSRAIAPLHTPGEHSRDKVLFEFGPVGQRVIWFVVDDVVDDGVVDVVGDCVTLPARINFG